MSSPVQDVFTIELERLIEEETGLERKAKSMEIGLSGLKDIDLLLGLARVKLALSLMVMGRISRGLDLERGEEMRAMVTDRAFSALRIVEGLLAENVSEDQKGIIQGNPLFAQVKERLEEFLLSGGGGFLETVEADQRKARSLSRSIVAAIRKYMSEDDRYPPLDISGYPPFVRKALLALFPVLIREKPEQPPYGIEEGEEIVYSSRNMKLPLSQAIFYMENEMLPELETRLAASPGDPELQEEIRRIRDQVREYRKLRFIPRSTPVLLEQGFHTEGMTFYTADGEMLVPIPLPVSFRSGTNLDRKMELVRMDVVRRIAGRGVSIPIDKEYRHLRSLESGIRGSSRAASLKIDPAWGYRVLRQEYPFLGRLGDKARFLELADMVRSGSLGSCERRVAALIEKDQRTQSGVPGITGISRSDPSWPGR